MVFEPYQIKMNVSTKADILLLMGKVHRRRKGSDSRDLHTLRINWNCDAEFNLSCHAEL